jgi:hypothetical protein
LLSQNLGWHGDQTNITELHNSVSKEVLVVFPFYLPGGDMVMSSEEGIVISITGLRDGKPFQAS